MSNEHEQTGLPHLEHPLAIQSAIEGLSPHEILARDELVNEFKMDHSEATLAVKNARSAGVVRAVS